MSLKKTLRKSADSSKSELLLQCYVFITYICTATKCKHSVAYFKVSESSQLSQVSVEERPVPLLLYSTENDSHQGQETNAQEKYCNISRSGSLDAE